MKASAILLPALIIGAVLLVRKINPPPVVSVGSRTMMRRNNAWGMDGIYDTNQLFGTWYGPSTTWKN